MSVDMAEDGQVWNAGPYYRNKLIDDYGVPHATTDVRLFIFCIQDEEPGYGGCEGPDAMYVKLISSDEHEFIVKREHALMSGTIKAMLSGPGQFAENETNEIHFREIP